MHSNVNSFGEGCIIRIFFSILTIFIVLFVPSSPLIALGESVFTFQGFIMIIFVLCFWIFAYIILSNWYFSSKDIDSFLFDSLDSESTI